MVWESLKNCVDNKSGVLPVETFKTLVGEGMEAPIGEEDWPKLLKIYDKKNEGVLNWEDLLSDHKYIHAVSIGLTELIHCIHDTHLFMHSSYTELIHCIHDTHLFMH